MLGRLADRAALPVAHDRVRRNVPDGWVEAGFSDVRRCGFQQGSVPDLEILDNPPEETLYMEASKPA